MDAKTDEIKLQAGELVALQADSLNVRSLGLLVKCKHGSE